MLNNKEDNFFDENKENNKDAQDLLTMINSYDKQIISDYKNGDKVSGKVTKIGNEYYFIDIQAKTEAILKKTDINEELKIGEMVSAFIIECDDEIILSTRMSAYKNDKQVLFDTYNNKIPVQGKITGVSKDGLTVKILGQRAFCPISQIDINYTEDINTFLGKTLDFIIQKISENGKNIILSRIPLLEEKYLEKLNNLTEGINSKKVYIGTITRITNYGLFIAIDGIEGLAHISELSWEHIDDPSEKFSVGQEVHCTVVKVEVRKPLKTSKISISIKQTIEDPWFQFTEKYSIGNSIQGKVVRLTNFGAFIEIIPGVDGLIHISEMSWVKKVNHPSEILSPGNMVNVTILSIDPIKKSVSLTLKDIASDPWKNIEEKFPVGKDFQGLIEKKSRYGYFITLSEGITGLLVFSNIHSDNKENFTNGQNITVTILSSDKENRRISLAFGTSHDNESKEIVKEYNQQQKKPDDSATEFGNALLKALSKKK